MYFTDRKNLAAKVDRWLFDAQEKAQRESVDQNTEGPEFVRSVQVPASTFNVLTALNEMGYLRDNPKR